MPVWPFVCSLPNSIDVVIAGLDSTGYYPAGVLEAVNGNYTLSLDTSTSPYRYKLENIHTYLYTDGGTDVYFENLYYTNRVTSDTIELDGECTALAGVPVFLWQYVPANLNGVASGYPIDTVCGSTFNLQSAHYTTADTCTLSY